MGGGGLCHPQNYEHWLQIIRAQQFGMVQQVIPAREFVSREAQWGCEDTVGVDG